MKNYPYPIYAENLQGDNSGDETAATIGDVINTASAITTPVDADLVPIADSADSFTLKKLTWANLKATIKAYIESVGLIVLKIVGTAGAGFASFVSQSSNPTAPASGTVNMFASNAASGVTRMNMQTSTGAVLVLFRDAVDTFRNETGSTITKGSVVYINSANGTVPTMALAKADAASTSGAVGFALANVSHNGFGTIQDDGVFTGLDTLAFSQGDTLWLSPTVAGAVTNVEPAAPGLGMRMGTVVTSSANGIVNIFIQPFVPSRNYIYAGQLNSAAVNLDGNLTFTGNTRRIFGEFSSLTSTMTMFQSSTSNGNTIVGLLPNGTAVASQIRLYSDSTITNGTVGRINNTGSVFVLDYGVYGTGTQGAISIRIANSEAVGISTARLVSFPETTDATSSTAASVTMAGGLGVVKKIISASSVTAHSGTAIPAGGTAGAGLLVSSTANFGVFFGSGAPSLTAAKGSLYLRSDGSSTSTRMYVNTDGGTTWTAVTTAA